MDRVHSLGASPYPFATQALPPGLGSTPDTCPGPRRVCPSGAFSRYYFRPVGRAPGACLPPSWSWEGPGGGCTCGPGRSLQDPHATPHLGPAVRGTPARSPCHRLGATGPSSCRGPSATPAWGQWPGRVDAAACGPSRGRRCQRKFCWVTCHCPPGSPVTEAPAPSSRICIFRERRRILLGGSTRVLAPRGSIPGSVLQGRQPGFFSDTEGAGKAPGQARSGQGMLERTGIQMWPLPSRRELTDTAWPTAPTWPSPGLRRDVTVEQ